MFIILSTPENNKIDELSYRIVKNPTSEPIIKQGNGTRKSIGKWIFHEGKNKYLVYTDNISPEYFENKKKQNFDSYVSFDLDGISFNNLGCMDDILRSAYTGAYPKGEAPIDVNIPMLFEVHIGPFGIKHEAVTGVFNNLGLDVEITDNNDSNTVTCAKLRATMSITEFLQKVYIGSLALTPRGDIPFLEQSRIDKIVKLTKNWVSGIDKAENIIKRVFKNNDYLFKNYSDNFEKTIDVEENEVKERKESVHDNRHTIIVELLQNKIGTDNIKTILELGCGGGKLLRRISSFYRQNNLELPIIIGMDIDERFGRYFKKDEINFSLMNFIYPFPNTQYICNDVLILSEVYEHLEKNERNKLLHLIQNFYVPKNIIFTVPNIAYTEYLRSIGNLSENEVYRHKDHKIEFTVDEFENEIAKLSNLYKIQKIEDYRLYKEEDTPPVSFMYYLTLIDKNTTYSDKVFKELESIFENNEDTKIDYIKKGYNKIHIHSNININDVFYLGPTISPYISDKKNEIENPHAIIDYYKSKGINKMFVQKKYMGSRCHIIVCRNEEIAERYNLSEKVVFISRNGTNLKKHIVNNYGQKVFDKLIEELYLTLYNPKLDRNMSYQDYVILDTEMLPWSITGEKLIRDKFIIPGDASYLKRLILCRDYNIKELDKFFMNSIKYKLSLSNYTFPYKELEFRVFDILNYNTQVTNDKEMMYLINRYFIDTKKTYFKPVQGFIYTTDDEMGSNIKLDDMWNDLDVKGEEGLVIKPINAPDNIVPYLKCRSKEYLRIIYGMDYTDKEIMEVVRHKKRSIDNKMSESLYEFHTCKKIMNNFIKRDFKTRDKLIYNLYGRRVKKEQYMDKTF